MRRFRAPWGLLGMLLFVPAVEAVMKAQEAGVLAAYMKESWRFAGHAADRKAAGAAVLAFGDSLSKFGLSPPALEAVTGRPAYNLAAYGGPPALSVQLLDRAVAAGARPGALVIAYLPANLTLAPRNYAQNWMLTSRPADCLDLAVTGRDAALLSWVLAGRLLPSVRRRGEVREFLASALRPGAGDPGGPARLLASHRRDWRRNRGGELLPVCPPRAIVADPTDRYLFPASWYWDPAQGVYFRRFLERAAGLGVPVYYVLPPVCRSVQEVCERTGLDARQTEMVRRVRARFPGLHVVDARYCRYPDGDFFDTVHLNARGADRLSRSLALVLRPALDGEPPRTGWVVLPPLGGPSGVGATVSADPLP